MTQSFESSILSVEEEESTLVLPHSQSVDDNLILEGMINTIARITELSRPRFFRT